MEYRATGHDIERVTPRNTKKEESPLPPLATGITLGLWIALMMILAFVVVPLLFGTCGTGIPAS